MLCVVWRVYTLYIVMSERPAAARICTCSLSRRMTDKRCSVYARLTRSSLSSGPELSALTLSLLVQIITNNNNFPMIIKSVRYNMVLSVSRRFSSVCNEKLHCMSLFMLQFIRRKGLDCLISFKKSAAQASLIQHHNILQESILTVLFI